jgi:hypothetical protein
MAEEKPAKPKITLEDIASSSAVSMQLQELAKDAYAGKLNGFYSYLQSIGGNPEEIEALRNYQTNPYSFSLDASHQADAAMKKSMKDTESGLGLIVSKLDQNTLSALAVEFGLKDKKYLTLAQAVKSEDRRTMVATVRDSYLERIKNHKGLVELAKTWGPETWIGYAGYEQGRMQQEFVKKNLYTTTEVEKDGKKQKEAKYDSAKGIKFLTKAILDLKGEEREKALLELGRLSQAIVAQEKAKKEKKA